MLFGHLEGRNVECKLKTIDNMNTYVTFEQTKRQQLETCQQVNKTGHDNGYKYMHKGGAICTCSLICNKNKTISSKIGSILKNKLQRFYCLLYYIKETRRRTVERECKNLNKPWPDLKQLAQLRVRWRVGVIDALCPGRHQGN